MPTLECKILTSETDIEALADEWRQLHARADGSPFADYDLFAGWWRTLGKTRGVRTLHVIAGRDAGRLAAVLPLTVMRRKGLRVMQAAGAKAYNCDMLAESAGLAARLWQVARQSPHYDFASIRDVYPESMCYQALASFARRGDENDVFFLRFDWPASKDWLASLPGDARGKFKRCTRRLQEQGAVSYEVYKGGPLPAAIIDDMVRKKVAWAATNKKSGLFEHPDVLNYYHKALEPAAAQGRLFLAWLKCGDSVISYNQGFIHQGVLHMPFWTYDPAWSRYSPGDVILVNSICWAIDNGMRGLDFRQGESQFKRKHSNEIRRCAEFTFGGSLKGRLAQHAFLTARSLWRIAKDKAVRARGRQDGE